MKVVVATGVYPPEIGGPATYSRLLETGLPLRGIDVDVVPFRLVAKYPKIVRHIVYWYLLLRRARTADVVYAMDPMSVGVPAFFACLVLRKKFLLKIVGDYAWEQARQRFGYGGTVEDFQTASVHPVATLFRITERFIARRAVRIVVPSKYLQRIVVSWGIPDIKIVTIYNGVSVGDVGVKETIRGLLHFDGKLIISVGRLVPWKGFDVLIRVFAKLKKKAKDIKLFIVGSGPDLEVLEALTEKEGVQDSVIFAGAVDHEALLRYIKASDIFVLNTSYEGLSHLVLETLAVGVPVVTTHVGGNPEVITDGVNGYLVKPNDMSALQSRITTLLEKPETYQKIQSAGLLRAAEFTDERVLQETATLLKGI